MSKFWWGLIVGLIAVPLLGGAYILCGFAPAAVTDKPFPLEAFVAGAALESRIHRSAPKGDLSSFTDVDLLAGAEVYRRGCGCHGLPGQNPAQNPAERPPAMFPPPPQLFTPDGYVTDDPVGVTYWKVKNGIRMTGMPSFAALFTERQMWQVAALLAKADKLPPEVVEKLKAPLFPLPPAEAGAPPAAGSKSKTR
jgi:thiosulfate dehydrogenase